MSPQITFKSTPSRTSAPGEALTDSAGKPVPPATTLAQAVLPPYSPSHGNAPDRLPAAPYGLSDLGPAAALRVIGPEREAWVQGMQTADVSAAPMGGALPALFLGGKGRLVAEALVWRYPEELIVTTIPERLDALHDHLDKLLIMEDCELSRVDGLHRLRFAPGTAPLGRFEDVAGSLQPLGLEVLVLAARAPELVAALPAADPGAVEAWRVALGLPAWGTELDEETTPVDAGLDRQISFGKGCYVGQEVVAMATYRGRVAWNLVRLQVRGASPVPGARLDPARAAQGKRGRVTSATQVGDLSVLLGYVHKELIVPGSEVALEDGRAATVLGLPFGSLPGAGVCA
ncbi:MAG: YgfZ/GcvT domain-containing protein [Myxococcales bacterium]